MRNALCGALVLLVGLSATAQHEEMTTQTLFKIAGERSAAASSGLIRARVTEYRSIKEGNEAAETYGRAVAGIIEALEGAGPEGAIDPARLTPDRSEWAVDTWYEIEYVYDKGRYRLSRVTPHGSYHSAFDGMKSAKVEQGRLYIEREPRPRQPMDDIDINLMRWDRILQEHYIRADQDGGLEQLDDNRYNHWLRNKKTGDAVDHMFNATTGMIERCSYRNAQGQLLQDYLWLRPVMDAVWVPSAFVKMERRGDQIRLEVVVYASWEVRPVSDDELAIPRDAYDNVAGSVFPIWRDADVALVSGVVERNVSTAARRQALPAQAGIDELELSKTPTESYVRRIVGMSLIVVALGLGAVYWVRWRTAGFW